MASIIRTQGAQQMPYDHDQVVQAQFQQLAAARAKALGDYESARIADDGEGTMDAADRILEADARLHALDRVAQNLARGQQPQPIAGAENLSREDEGLCRKYGLSPHGLAIAKGWTSNSRLPDTEKIETYLRNTQRYNQARADGSYRDDQGVVKR
jgi:hypothetical protein